MRQTSQIRKYGEIKKVLGYIECLLLREEDLDSPTASTDDLEILDQVRYLSTLIDEAFGLTQKEEVTA